MADGLQNYRKRPPFSFNVMHHRLTTSTTPYAVPTPQPLSLPTHLVSHPISTTSKTTPTSGPSLDGAPPPTQHRLPRRHHSPSPHLPPLVQRPTRRDSRQPHLPPNQASVHPLQRRYPSLTVSNMSSPHNAARDFIDFSLSAMITAGFLSGDNFFRNIMAGGFVDVQPETMVGFRGRTRLRSAAGCRDQEPAVV
jgi:hypothetical protein